MTKARITEDCLCYRLGWFIRLRWAAAIGILPGMFFFATFFHLQVEWAPFILMTAALFGLNAAFSWYYKKTDFCMGDGREPLPSAYTFAHIQVLSDLMALTVLIYFLGTLRYPYYLFYTFHIIIASLLLRRAMVFVYATIALLLFCLAGLMEYYIPNTALQGESYPLVVREVFFEHFFALFLPLLSGFYIAAYMASSITESLRARQREITELSEKLKLKNAELNRHSEVRERFMSVAFHDLKAPLAAAEGYLNILKNDIGNKSEEEKQQMIERMYSRVSKLITFLKDLRDYSGIELGEQDEVFEPIDIRKAAIEAADINKMLASAKGLELVFDFPNELPPVYGLKVRAIQLFNNLLSNAVKFTEQGEVRFAAKLVDKNIIISVSDTGPGIAKADIEKIFDDFYRTAETKSKKIEGSGLGLAIAKNIVRQMRGSITVESELGKGTSFIVSLPIYEPKAD